MEKKMEIQEQDVILDIRNLKKYFYMPKGVVVHAVEGVDLQLKRGETLGLVGESGSGKSTIAYDVIGMYKPTSGEMIFDGEVLNPDIRKRPLKQKGDMQIVFQDPGSSMNPRATIETNLAFPIKRHGGLKDKKAIHERVLELLRFVGLPEEYAQKYPRSIGGGERQLACIARALASNPKLVILDEPTSALDVSIQAKVIRRLIDLQKELNLSYLFITHDLSLMRNLATKVAILYLGRLCEVAETAEFYSNPKHPYTQMLLASIPVVTEEEERLRPVKVESRGEIPNPANMPTGCGFNTRCSQCMEICKTEYPQMKEVSPGHYVCCHAVEGKPVNPVSAPSSH